MNLSLSHSAPLITFVLIAGNVNKIAILSHLTSSHHRALASPPHRIVPPAFVIIDQDVPG